MTVDTADEFSWLPEVAQELRITPPMPTVERVARQIDGRIVSALRWAPQLTLELIALHGGGQNAHTWDATLLATGRPSLAVDLPGHGHSSWRDDLDYHPTTNAATVSRFLDIEAGQTRPRAGSLCVLVGMSLGGLTSLQLAVDRPELVKHLVLVDVTPNSGIRVASLAGRAQSGFRLLGDTSAYETLSDMVASAAVNVSARSSKSLERGVRHNAVRGTDGRWRWRADRRQYANGWHPSDRSDLWPLVGRLKVPITLVVAEGSGVVTPADIDQFVALAPHAEVLRWPTCSHSIQSAMPHELGALLKAL